MKLALLICDAYRKGVDQFDRVQRFRPITMGVFKAKGKMYSSAMSLIVQDVGLVLATLSKECL